MTLMELHNQNAVHAIVRHLSNTKQYPWYDGSRSQRTMSKITEWLDEELNHPARQGSKIQGDLVRVRKLLARQLYVEGHPLAGTEMATIEDTAEFLLAGGYTQPNIKRIGSMEDAIRHLRPYGNLGLIPGLLTKEKLLHELDRAPGGLEFFATTTPEAIRANMRDAWGNAPELPLLTGHPLLYDLIDDERLDPVLLNAANRVLLRVLGYSSALFLKEHKEFHGLVQRALAATQSKADREALEALNALPYFVVQPALLHAPSVRNAAGRIRGFYENIELTEAQTRFFEDLLVVLEATPGRSRTQSADPLGNELVENLRAMVWEHVVTSTKLLSKGQSREENLKRLRDLYLDPELTPSDVSVFDRIYQMVKRDGDRKARFEPAADFVKETTAPLTTYELLMTLKGIDTGSGLPPKSAVPIEVREAIEATSEVDYNDTYLTMLAPLGFTKTNASQLELHVESLLRRTTLNVKDFKTQYHHPVIDARQSIDHVALVQLPGKTAKELEILIECQGEQHFKDGRFGYSYELDVRKSTAVLGASDALSKNRLLINLHHGLLVRVPENRKLTAEQFDQLVQFAVQKKAWWIYACPKGSKDRNGHPLYTSTHRARSEELRKLPTLSKMDVYFIAR